MNIVEAIEELILPIIVALIAAGPGLLAIAYITQERKKKAAEAKETEAKAEKVKADTMATIEATARSAAQSVLDKNTTIAGLEKSVDEFRARIRAIEDENEKLKDDLASVKRDNQELKADNTRKGKQIQALQDRVRHLENELRQNGLPIPAATKDVE